MHFSFQSEGVRWRCRSLDSSNSSGDDGETDTDDASPDVVAGESGTDVVDIGVVLPLSGSNEVYEVSSRRGFELAPSDFDSGMGPDDVSFSASFLDDEGHAELGVRRFAEHIENGIDVIFGPTLSNTAFEAHPVAQEHGIPVLAISNTAAGITDICDFSSGSRLPRRELCRKR